MIEIFNERGEPRDYMTMAERLPEFLKRYGPDRGYSIRTRVRGHLGMHPDLTDLYRSALSAGVSLTDLPTIDMSVFRFEAQLFDVEGRIVAEASALRRINTSLEATFQARAWEAGETAALQRLLARVGYGSDTLLADELGDIDGRGVAYAHEREGPVTSRQEGDLPDGGAKTSVPTAEPKPPTKPQTSSKSEGGMKAEGKPEAPPKPEILQNEPDKGAEASEALLRQIRHLASVRGIEPPAVTTRAEAKEALKALRATPAAQ